MNIREGLSIRPADAGDIAAVAAIYAHHVLHGLASFELDPPDADEMRRRYDTLTGAGYPFLVAERHGEVVGYAYAGPYRTRPAYRGTVENSVYVAPDFANRGIGRALLEALIEAAAARGYRQMVAIIGDSGNTASIALHRTCGFDETGVLKSVGFKFGRWVDSVLMQRPLGPGDGTSPD